MYETELPEWLAVAEAMVQLAYDQSYIEDDMTIDVEDADTDTTDKTRTVYISGEIDVCTHFERGDSMDYFNGTGVKDHVEVDSATFIGTMTVKDEDETVIYEQDVKFEIE